MAGEPRYPAAREIAPKIQAHFARFLALTAADHHVGPTADDIEAVVDAAFWASLRREENYLPRISLALLPADLAENPVTFATPLPLSPVALVKVAPAVERHGIHLGVWRDSGTLRVWGTTQVVPASCMVLEVAAPFLLFFKHHRGDGGKYVNVAVLEADRVKMISDHAMAQPDCPALITTLLGYEGPGWNSHLNVLVELAVSIRAHGRGGIMLMVPTGSTAWRESIVEPIPYSINPVYNGLADV